MSSIFIDAIPFEESRFARDERWSFDAATTSEIAVLRISTAPRGKHDLAMCATYSRAWRDKFGSLLSLLTANQLQCFIWAEGPYESDGLLRFLQYVDQWNDRGLIYYIDAVRSEGGRGYYSSWASVEFNSEVLESAMNDEDLDFEMIAGGVIAQPSTLHADYCKALEEIGPRILTAGEGLVFRSITHFEGCELAMHRKRFPETLDSLVGWQGKVGIE